MYNLNCAAFVFMSVVELPDKQHNVVRFLLEQKVLLHLAIL